MSGGWGARTVSSTILVLMVAWALGTPPAPASAGPKGPIAGVRPSAPSHGATTGVTSSDWAGYADTGPSQSFTDVKGSWIEPSISCSSSFSARNDDSFWIGLDGVTSGTVEQTGSEGLCSGSTAHYDVWYEMFPKPPFTVFGIRAGDQISAEVASSGTKRFTLMVSDVTSGKHFEKTLNSALAERSSAEWIVEESSACTNCLEDFGTVTFTSASATKNGTTGGIGAFSNQAIAMRTNNVVMAETSALESGGASFTVKWKSP